ncbi:MAG: HlyD family efflux transporter periplasmic adaptor subunit [Cyclobacteriaceae bacterium]
MSDNFNRTERIKARSSEEVEDIIENIPNTFNKVLIWGVLLVIMIFLILGYFTNYSDTVVASVTIKARKAPRTLVSKSSGNLMLLAGRGEIKKGTNIAYLENSSNFDDVLYLKNRIFGLDIESDTISYEMLSIDTLNLGDMEQNYYAFLDNYYSYFKNKTNNKYVNRIDLLSAEYILHQSLLSQRNLLIKSKETQKDLQRKKVLADSMLYLKEGLSELDFDNSKMNFMLIQNEQVQLNLNLISDSIYLTQIKNEIENLKIENIDNSEKLRINLLNSFRLLVSKISEWESKYVFVAEIDGTLEYLDHYENGKFVKTSEPLFSILPSDNSFVGLAYLSSNGAGKVQPGQKAIIKLNSYPYQEFGFLEGEVTSVSLIANADNYLNTIKLSNNLVSNIGLELDFSAEMKGEAEIITKKRRLVERLYSKMRYLFSE